MTEKGKMMSDYIKREDALEQFDYYDLGEYLTTQIRDMLMDIPSADVAPVRHGRWVSINEYPYEKCSICGETHDTVRCLDNYCPNCGAKMDEEVD
jgi:hypothetical protein